MTTKNIEDVVAKGDKDSNYIEIDGVKFTFTVDEEKLKHTEMMTKVSHARLKGKKKMHEH